MADDIRVLIVDDQALLRDAFSLLVDSAPGMDAVGTASSGADAIRRCAELRPDVVLMDVRMPGMNGIEATRDICTTPDAPRVLVLTMFDLDDYVYSALRAGASGFLLKNAPPTELLHAIRVIHEGNALLAPEVTRRLISRLAPARTASGIELDRRIQGLTKRERETFVLIARGRSNDEIGRDMFLSPATVRTYVSRILTKTGARDRAQLVVMAYESGLATATAPLP